MNEEELRDYIICGRGKFQVGNNPSHIIQVVSTEKGIISHYVTYQIHQPEDFDRPVFYGGVAIHFFIRELEKMGARKHWTVNA